MAGPRTVACPAGTKKGENSRRNNTFKMYGSYFPRRDGQGRRYERRIIRQPSARTPQISGMTAIVQVPAG